MLMSTETDGTILERDDAYQSVRLFSLVYKYSFNVVNIGTKDLLVPC